MNQTEALQEKTRLKAYSNKELAIIYKVSSRTMQRWISPFKGEIGLRNGHYYTPKQTKVIFEKLGIPDLN